MIANAVITLLSWMAVILAPSAQNSSPIAMTGQSRNDALAPRSPYQIRRRWLAILVIAPALPCTVFASHAAVGVENYSRPYVMLLTPVVGILALVLGALLFSTLPSKHRAIKTLAFAFLAMVIWGAYGNWSFHRYSLLVDELCDQAGIYVYKTVEAGGFVGLTSIRTWAAYGFRYLEYSGRDQRKYRLTLRDGEPHRQPIEHFTSDYEFKHHGSSEVGGGIRKSSFSVVDRRAGDILGSVLAFSIPPSPLDRIIKFLPAEDSAWTCAHNHFDQDGKVESVKSDARYTITHLIKATLIPTGQTERTTR